MTENKVVAEQHGCIVCGKTHRMLVVYSPTGQLVDCTVTNGGGQRVPDERRPLVACDTHGAKEVERAYLLRYPGLPQAEDIENEED